MDSRLANFEILCKLGAGAYSSVYKVQRKSDGQIYAFKKVKLMDIGDREKQNALNEVRIIASVHHENIVQYKECFIEDNNLCIIMEYAEQGDLLQKIQKHVKKQSYIPEKEIWSTAVQVLNGLRALHRKKILHRDLKCANIFLYDNDVVKLGDFNVSKLAKNGLVYTQTGTPYYASPEVWQDKPYDLKADIWSLGCVLYEACALKPPFRAKDMDGLYKTVLKGQYSPIPGSFSPDLVQLIKLMMQLLPQNRPDCDKLLTSNLVLKKVKQYDLNLMDEDQKEDLLKTIKWPGSKKGLQSNKSEMITLNFQLPGSNYLNQHNSNHIRRNQQSTRIKSQDNNDSIASINQTNEALNQIMKQLTQLEQKDIHEKSPIISQPTKKKLNKSNSKQAVQDQQASAIPQIENRRLRISNSTHENHQKYESHQPKCASKDRIDQPIVINANYYAKDVIQSLSKQQYSQKLPQIGRGDDEYMLRKNSSNERSNIKKSKHDQSSLSIKKDISVLPSADRPSLVDRPNLLKKIIEEQQLPKLKKR